MIAGLALAVALVAILLERTPDLFAIIETGALIVAGALAVANYSKLCRDIDSLVDEQHIHSWLDAIEYQQFAVIAAILSTFVVVDFSTHPYNLPYAIAVIYFLYCFTNYRVCNIIVRNQIEPKNNLRAATMLAQNYIFLTEENWISLVAYLSVVTLAFLVIFFGSFKIHTIATSDQINALVAGMAIFHLIISAVRFRSFASRRPDQTLIGELIQAYEQYKTAIAVSGKELFISLLKDKIKKRYRSLSILGYAVVIFGIIILLAFVFGYIEYTHPATSVPHAN